ncbi:MAG: flagellin [Pseudomonadota bacterium]
MSSILTNNSAMVALQTLKSINMNLGKVQSEISTGKSVESAKDNAAVWAISKVMSSDVAGFDAISDSLALGQATVGVALNASESVTDLLTEIKGKIVNSQEENVDRAKIQTDIEALANQIGSIVGAAQFNGLNLLNDDGIELDEQTSNILASLDRGSNGSVTSGEISVDRVNLGTNTASYVEANTTYAAGSAAGGGAVAATVDASDGASAVIGVTGTAITQTAGTVFVLQLTGTDADASNFTPADFTTNDGADGNTADIAYVAQEGDTAVEVAAGLKAAFDVWRVDNGLDADDFNIVDDGDGSLTGTSANGLTDATDTIAFQVNVRDSDLSAGATTRAGELAMLGAIDVSTDQGAEDALNAVEGLIQTSIDTAAALGSSGRRIETQADFVSKLTDKLTSGIGALVDADMEAASARLQALQTQQQLGVQALSIANQAPQTILSLFR